MMKRILFLVLLACSQAFGQADPGSMASKETKAAEVVAYNSTLAFDAGARSSWRLSLTGNVTSSSITGHVAGQTLRFFICQDTTGNRTFAWPTAFVSPPAILTTASNCNLYIFVSDGVNIANYSMTAGGGGGAVSSVFGRTGAVVKQANDYDWMDISGKPSTFAPSAHTHDWTADITGKPTLAASMTNVSHKWLNSYDAATGLFTQTQPDYGDLTGIPSTFAPSAHTHVKADITDFGSYEAPLTFNTGLTRSTNTITCNTASGTVFGCLASADWTTFNGKQAALGFTPANSTVTISTTAPITGGGDLSGNRTFAMAAATTSVDGYLTSTNWNTFNGKQAALGFTPANSTVTISTTAPITGGGDLSTNRTFAMAAATTSVSGHLTSTDWNTFNGKQAALGFTPENAANKNAASGYVGLSAGSKITASQMSAVLASSDLTNDSALEKTANKNAASGYAGLSAGSLLTASQIPAPGASTFGGVKSLTCSGTDKVSAIGTDGIPVCGADQTSAGGPVVAKLTADTGTSATNTLITTGMTFSIAASTSYKLDCDIIFTVSTTAAVGLTLGVNGPGTPTQVSLMRQINTTATAFRVDSSQSAGWAAKIGATATTVTALSMARLYGTIENGSTAGTLDIQFANIGTTGTTVVKRGSSCRLQ